MARILEERIQAAFGTRSLSTCGASNRDPSSSLIVALSLEDQSQDDMLNFNVSTETLKIPASCCRNKWKGDHYSRERAHRRVRIALLRPELLLYHRRISRVSFRNSLRNNLMINETSLFLSLFLPRQSRLVIRFARGYFFS